MSYYSENILQAGNFWCYYKRILRNKNTGTESLIDSGSFYPVTSGILRAGVKVSNLSDTEEIREYTLLTFKPDFSRMSNADLPTLAKLKMYFSNCIINNGNTDIDVNIRPWSNPNGLTWVTATPISYDALDGYYVPFDVNVEDYDPATYEDTETIQANAQSVTLEDLEQTFYKFLQSQSTGFTISATKGYCDIFGPTYSNTGLRPFFTINQTVTGRSYNILTLDTELRALSKVKGLCRDKNGTTITGKQCRVTAFDSENYKIIGTGLSSLDGSFLISVDYKVGYPVIVSFIEEIQSLTGAELMVTVSNDTV